MNAIILGVEKKDTRLPIKFRIMGDGVVVDRNDRAWKPTQAHIGGLGRLPLHTLGNGVVLEVDMGSRPKPIKEAWVDCHFTQCHGKTRCQVLENHQPSWNQPRFWENRWRSAPAYDEAAKLSHMMRHERRSM